MDEQDQGGTDFQSKERFAPVATLACPWRAKNKVVRKQSKPVHWA